MDILHNTSEHKFTHYCFTTLFSDNYWTNPQFFVTLKETDIWDGIDKCIMIISLEQKYERQNTDEIKDAKLADEAIGFDVLKVLDLFLFIL